MWLEPQPFDDDNNRIAHNLTLREYPLHAGTDFCPEDSGGAKEMDGVFLLSD